MNEAVSLLKSNDRPDEGRVEAGIESPSDYRMIQRGDFVQAGRWHWRCRREDATGEVAYGYVEADSLGKAIDPETFEKDWS
jgi:hypothetical protein